MNSIIDDAFYMRLAIGMAERVVGQTSVNPPVGCVIVRDGRVIGIGAHLKRGEGHAEVHALKMAGSEANRATAYVTLEPCSHYGKTPPCSLKLIEASVKRVVVACIDPNPLVAGRGIDMLRQHGIEVITNVLEQEAGQLIAMFAKYVTTKMPYVTMKTAATLDGKIATHTGHSQWITNTEVKEHVHTMRHRHQAIMVGIETVLKDDPSLTTRLSVPALHPIRMVIDSKLRLPLHAKLVTDRSAPTWVFTTNQADSNTASALEAQGVRVIRVSDGPFVNLTEALKICGDQEVASILLEGGGILNGAMLEAGLIDRVVLMMAPKVIGHPAAPSVFCFDGPEKMSDALELEDVDVQKIGDNIMISGSPVNRAARGEETPCLPG